jgi:dienelactone hydrolase
MERRYPADPIPVKCNRALTGHESVARGPARPHSRRASVPSVGRGVRAIVVPIALALAALAAAPAVASARTPEAFGPHAVRFADVRVPVPVDPGGPEGAFRSLHAHLYVPAGRGPWPVVQISHAWPGTLREFPLSGWGRRLASRGFVTIVSDRRAASAALVPSLDQPSDVLDFDAGVNAEDVLRLLRWAIAQGSTRGSPLYRRVDPHRLAIAGHSLGGYFATFAAVRSLAEGPRLSALVLLDPTDERLGEHTLNSSLDAAPSVRTPAIVLGSEANQHPIQCDMRYGDDCTIVSTQEYAALTHARARFGLKVVGAVHEDIEDPSTGPEPSKPRQLRTFQRYGMAWLEYWLGGDCGARGYLGGAASARDARAHRIAIYRGRRMGRTPRDARCPRP